VNRLADRVCLVTGSTGMAGAAAERAARFVLDRLRGPDGRLFHRFRLGERAIRGQGATRTT